MERADIAGGLIINRQNKVLLVYNQETDSWTYPKGHVKGNEDFLKTALREIREETGIENLRFIAKLPVYERSTRQKKNKIKVMHMFLFHTEENTIVSNTSDVTEIHWVSIEKVPEYFSYKEEVEFFESIKNMLKYRED